MKKKNPKIPAARGTCAHEEPAVPILPPEEERISRQAAAAFIEARRHDRRAEDYYRRSGTPYTGKDKRLVGSTFHDRESLLVWGDLAEEEKKEAERCVEEGRRALDELKDLRKIKAQQAHTAAIREHAAAIRASQTPPATPVPSPTPRPPKKRKKRRPSVQHTSVQIRVGRAFIAAHPDLRKTVTGRPETRGLETEKDGKTYRGRAALFIIFDTWRNDPKRGGKYYGAALVAIKSADDLAKLLDAVEYANKADRRARSAPPERR